MMVSVWWAIGTFLLGTCVGTLVFALITVAARGQEQSDKEEEAVGREGLGSIKLEEQYSR